MGDFNDILNKEERCGTKVKYHPADDFLECITRCCLEDVKYCGSFFTRSDKQKGEERLYSKIDRVRANSPWLDTYMNAEVNFLTEGLFDHSPVVLSIHPEISSGKKPFRYFRMWSTHPEYHDRIKTTCQGDVQGTSMYKVVTKIKKIKGVLKELNRQGFSDIQAAACLAKAKLEECQKKLQEEQLNQKLQEEESYARSKYEEVSKNYLSFLQ
uniref:Endonuclease/exonuclease/phosphatase domain-containing protein n=1 Tax=Cannabis sativa TaxID=3483 RepID=A0A803PA09_CANSA